MIPLAPLGRAEPQNGLRNRQVPDGRRAGITVHDQRMLTADQFRRRWCDDNEEVLIVFPASALEAVDITEGTRTFLAVAGLPIDAAPFLSFSAPPTSRWPTAADEWPLSDDYHRYRVIGFNDSGDPLCLDTVAGGAVVYLNHDDKFRRVLVNSDVTTLGESLLTFRQLVREAQRRNGVDAYIDGDVPRDVLEWCRAEIRRIDEAAMSGECDWPMELDSMLTDATE